MFFLGLLLFYGGHLSFQILATEIKRKNLKVGDVCNVYIGESKFSGPVLKINRKIDVWVIDQVIRFSRKEIYA